MEDEIEITLSNTEVGFIEMALKEYREVLIADGYVDSPKVIQSIIDKFGEVE